MALTTYFSILCNTLRLTYFNIKTPPESTMQYNLLHKSIQDFNILWFNGCVLRMSSGIDAPWYIYRTYLWYDISQL